MAGRTDGDGIHPHQRKGSRRRRGHAGRGREGAGDAAAELRGRHRRRIPVQRTILYRQRAHAADHAGERENLCRPDHERQSGVSLGRIRVQPGEQNQRKRQRPDAGLGDPEQGGGHRGGEYPRHDAGQPEHGPLRLERHHQQAQLLRRKGGQKHHPERDHLHGHLHGRDDLHVYPTG